MATCAFLDDKQYSQYDLIRHKNSQPLAKCQFSSQLISKWRCQQLAYSWIKSAQNHAVNINCADRPDIVAAISDPYFSILTSAANTTTAA